MRESAKKKRIILLSAGFILLALIAVGAGILWYKVIQYKIFPRNWGVVESGKIYRSGRIDPALIEETLRKNGIRTIISLDGYGKHLQTERMVARKLRIKIFYFDLHGSGLFSAQEYADVLKTLLDSSKNNLPVLIHCVAGANRTGGVIAVYRILVEKKPPDEAYSELVHFGWSPTRNKELVVHLNKNMETIARLLVENGTIDKIPDPVPQLKVDF